MSTSVYVWGDNRRCQLGLTPTSPTCFEPSHLSSLDGRSIVATAGGASHTLFLTEFGDVYACGRNVEGQCGQPHRKDMTVPTLVQGPLSEHRVVALCCSAFSSLVVTSSGRVYEFGLLHESEVRPGWQRNPTRSSDLRSSNSDTNTDTDTETKRADPQQHNTRLTGLADAIDATPHSEIVARIVQRSNLRYLQEGCEEGVQLDEGILSVKTKKVIVNVPRVVTSLHGIQIQLCAAGDGHIIVVARDGTMYSCGANDRGQLGDGTRVNNASFVKVMPILNHRNDEWTPVQVAIGQQHNVVLLRHRGTSRGIICTWGSGALGQLGQGTSARDSLRPRPVLFALHDQNIISIACGSNHSAAVTQEGKVFMWGHSEYGQLDPGSSGGRDRRHHGRYYYEPREFLVANNSPPIASISCTTHATIATDVQGGVHAWGWNSHGVLGRGKGRVALGAQHIWKLRDQTVTHVGVGHSHVVALVQGGSSFDLAIQFHELLNNNSNNSNNSNNNSGEDALFADVHVTWPGGHGKKDQVLSMHRALLQARCPSLLTELLPTEAGQEQTQEQEQDSQEQKKSARRRTVPLVLLPCPATLKHVRLPFEHRSDFLLNPDFQSS